MSTPLVLLGRDGMGPAADEADFDAWVAYVTRHLESCVPFAVGVEAKSGGSSLQNDFIRNASDDQRATLGEALTALWQDFCADESAWPERNTP